MMLYMLGTRQLALATMLSILILSLILSVTAVPSIYLVEPRNVVMYLPKGQKSIDAKLKYQLFNLHPSDGISQFCYDVFNQDLNKNLIEGACESIDVTDLIMHDLVAGKYMMTSYLKHKTDEKDESIPETKIINYFSIESYSEYRPRLGFLTNDKELDFMIVNEQSNAADVSFEYTLTESPISANNYQVCVNIAHAGTSEVVLPLTCLDSSQRLLTLKNMNKGAYIVELILKDAQSGALEEDSKVSISLNVKPLVELLPTIHLVDSPLEYVLDPDSHVAEVSLKYLLEGTQVAVAQVRACLRIDKLELNADKVEVKVPLLDTTCVPREHNMFTLSRMAEGRYSATLTLQNEQRPSVFYASRDVEVMFEIRDSEEFTPSYEWQTIHAWNTIPAGIVTRLPLSGNAAKEGRIPDPWMLQIAMPFPCKYFLRMEAHRETSIMDIKKKAAAKCKFPPECFLLYGDNVLLEDASATVEATNFFNVNKRLELDSDSCSVLIEKYRTQQESHIS